MPTRGRPERPRSSVPETNVAYGRGSVRGVDFGLGVFLTDTRYLVLDVGVGVAEQQQAGIGLGVGVADLQAETIQLGIGVMDWSGDTKNQDLFAIGIMVGESAGYAAPPRLALPNAISLGQEVRRRGEPIPTID